MILIYRCAAEFTAAGLGFQDCKFGVLDTEVFREGRQTCSHSLASSFTWSHTSSLLPSLLSPFPPPFSLPLPSLPPSLPLSLTDSSLPEMMHLRGLEKRVLHTPLMWLMTTTARTYTGTTAVIGYLTTCIQNRLQSSWNTFKIHSVVTVHSE